MNETVNEWSFFCRVYVEQVYSTLRSYQADKFLATLLPGGASESTREPPFNTTQCVCVCVLVHEWKVGLF